jgi:uncharacterized membrane protein
MGEDKMSLLNKAKIIGGVGALLTPIGMLIPNYGAALGIIGTILVIIAVKYISDETKNKSIFNNYLYFFILFIVGILAAVSILIFTLQAVGGLSYIMELQNLAYISNPYAMWKYIQPVLTGVLAAVVILWILMLIGTWFLKKSFYKIAELTNAKWFKTAGLVFLIGAATLILVIGVFITIIAMILEIIAFLSLPDKLPNKTE